jgi:hypothetical protein
MSDRKPDFDIDLAIGAQSELWVASVREALAGKSRVEVKAPKPFLEKGSAFVEYACLRNDGEWHRSGINDPELKAELYILCFGVLPGGLIVETQWLKRAALLAYKNPNNRREEKDGSHPTKGVVVSLRHLWETRPGEP